MIKNIVSVAAAVLGAGALLTGCDFEQPNAGCIVQDASFANWVAQYELKAGQDISTTCQTKLVKGIGATYDKDGEVIGVFKFADPEKENASVLTIRPRALYTRAALDPCDPATIKLHPEWATSTGCAPEADESTSPQTAVGKLAEEPDAQNFCSTSDWKTAVVRPRPAGSVNPDTAPTTTIKYKFDNVKVYAAADAPGTQFSADLTYTRDECTANYTVRAIWPAAPCNPGSTRESEKCGAGSGLNPNFAIKCDTSFRISNATDDDGNFLFPGTCVAANEIPSFIP
jgi:hypothetical protein